MLQNSRPVEILLVEDNPGDVRLTQEGLKEGRIINRLHHAKDGEDAMNFLLKNGVHSAAVTPDLVLLDLNLPRQNGYEVLNAMKSDLRLSSIPVVVLTTLDSDRELIESYPLRADYYIAKPIRPQNFLEVIKSLENFWLRIDTLPASP